MNSVTQVKARLKLRLKRHLPGVLGFADNAADDGIVTPPPYAIYTSEHMQLDGFPTIEMVVRGSRKSVNTSADEYQHVIPLAVTLAGDDEETLTVQVERYIWSLRQFVTDRANLDLEAVDLGWEEVALDTVIGGNEQYMPIVHGRDTGLSLPFVKGAAIEFFITTIE